MGTANRAYGTQMNGPLPFHGLAAGYRDEYGTRVPAGGVLQAYVHSGGKVDGMPEDIARLLYTDINSALALCRSGVSDTIVVLPGHTENVDAADDWSNLVAGVNIIGMGVGNNRPTFTWTAAASTVLLDVANVRISNMVFECAGDPTSSTALSVTAPITVSAAGCVIDGCRIRCSVDADQQADITITTTAAADDFTIDNCKIHGEGDGTAVDTLIRLVGADRFTMTNCSVHGFTSSTTVGVLQMLTTASTDVFIHNCSFTNLKAASVHAATGMAASTGVVSDCNFGILDNATLPGWETEGNLQFFRCETVNLAGEKSVPATPLSTT